MSDTKYSEARKALQCLYVAVDEQVARDAGAKCIAAYEEMEEELAQVKRREQVMREALEYRCSHLSDEFTDEARIVADKALATDAGSTLLTREQVQPLVDVLRDIRDNFDCDNSGHNAHAGHCRACEATKALAHARILGFK